MAVAREVLVAEAGAAVEQAASVKSNPYVFAHELGDIVVWRHDAKRWTAYPPGMSAVTATSEAKAIERAIEAARAA